MPTRTIVVATALVLPAAAIASATALAGRFGSVRAHSGPVTATLSWDGPQARHRNIALTISRGATVAFHRPVPEAICARCDIDDAAPDAPILISDLDGDHEPEVVVDSIGACCEKVTIFDWRPATGRYGELVAKFPAGVAVLGDLDGDGRREISSVDTRLDGLLGVRFDPRDTTLLPPRIFVFERPRGVGRLVDRTRRFGFYLREVAHATLQRFTQHRRTGRFDSYERAAAGAYVADECLLRRCAAGLRVLDRRVVPNNLGTPREAQAFRARLVKTLHTFGYR